MASDTLHFTARATAEMVRRELDSAFPEVGFDIKVDTPSPPFPSMLVLSALIVAWDLGPKREEVEKVVAQFQGLEWNPETGILEEKEHFVVNPGGGLQRLSYGVDYVFCHGPS